MVMRVSVNDEISKYLSIKRNRRGCVHPVEFRCRTTKRRPASYNLQEITNKLKNNKEI